MKQLVLFPIAMAILLTVLSCGPENNSQAVTRTYTSDAQVIYAAVGEMFVIEVPSNPTLPYRWEVSLQGPVALQQETYIPTTPLLTGSGGKSRFLFKAEGANPATITFSYTGADGTVSAQKVPCSHYLARPGELFLFYL